MKIEHGSYAFKPAELPALDVPSVEQRLPRLFERTIEKYMRLMLAISESTDARELQSLRDEAGRIATEWFKAKAVDRLAERIQE